MTNYRNHDDRGQTKLALAAQVVGMPPLPTHTPYGLIVADPPWQYNLRESDETHRGRTPYPNMDDAAILDFPMWQLASDRACYLLLWVTNNHLPLGFECLKRWGFEYKAIHHWIKTTKDADLESDRPKTRMGLGHWGRNCSESFLVGVKGEARSFSSVGLTNVPNVFYAPVGEHSRKPDQFWAIANRLKGALNEPPAIELFAREPRDRWDSWGLEA